MWRFADEDTARVATPAEAWVLRSVVELFFTNKFTDRGPEDPGTEVKLYVTYPPELITSIAGASPWLEHWNILSFSEQAGALSIAIRAMLSPEVPQLNQTAMLECAAYAPFSWLMMCVEDECDTQNLVQEDTSISIDEIEFGSRAMMLACLYALTDEQTVDESNAGIQVVDSWFNEDNGEEGFEDEEFEEDFSILSERKPMITGLPEGPWEGDPAKWFDLLSLLLSYFFAHQDWNIMPPTISPEHPEISVNETLQDYKAVNDLLRHNPDYFSTSLHRLNLPQTFEAAEPMLDELAKHLFAEGGSTLPPTVQENLNNAGLLWVAGDYYEIQERALDELGKALVNQR